VLDSSGREARKLFLLPLTA
jgi:hypothetical protein